MSIRSRAIVCLPIKPDVQGAAAIRLHVSSRQRALGVAARTRAHRAGDSDHGSRARPARTSGRCTRWRRSPSDSSRPRSTSSAIAGRSRGLAEKRGGHHPARSRDLGDAQAGPRTRTRARSNVLGKSEPRRHRRSDGHLHGNGDAAHGVQPAHAARLEAVPAAAVHDAGRHPCRFEKPPAAHPQRRRRTLKPICTRRQLAPEGTGPNHITRQRAGLASLEASQGRRLMATRRARHRARASLAVRLDGERSRRRSKTASSQRVIDVVRRRHAAGRTSATRKRRSSSSAASCSRRTTSARRPTRAR